MRYRSFQIQNFKGIKNTTIELRGLTGASVFALVGLNESGKTTILEAIHSFSPDKATSELVGGDEDTGVPIVERVPRHQISSFSGDVSVLATVTLDKNDIKFIDQEMLSKHKLQIDINNFPQEVGLERHQRFKDGDFQKSFFTLRAQIKVRSLKQKNGANLL